MARAGKCCDCTSHKCCQACENHTPESWSVTIGGETRLLRMWASDDYLFPAGLFNEARCLWEGKWSTPFAVGSCTVDRLWFSFDAQGPGSGYPGSVAGPPYIARFVAYGIDGNTVAEWQSGPLEYFNCTQSITLSQIEIEGAGDCGGLDDITITPIGAVACCCPACSTGTPYNFSMQVTSLGALVMPVQTLSLDWSSCATWSAKIPEDEDLGCTVNRATLEIVAMSGGYGWQLTLYDVDNPGTNYLRFRSPTAVSSSLPITCLAEEGNETLEAIAGGCGPFDGEANISFFNVKHCESMVDCFGCLPGTVPARYQVDVTGMVNWTASLCAVCDDLNGTYVLERVNSCLFALDIPDVCGYYRVELLVGGSGYYVSFLRQATPLAALRYVEENLPAPRDCRETAFNLDAQGGVGYCNHFVSTCTITAL